MKFMNAKEMSKISESNLEKIVDEQNVEIERILIEVMNECMKAADKNEYEVIIGFPYIGIVKKTVVKIIESLGYKVVYFERGFPTYSYLRISWEKIKDVT